MIKEQSIEQEQAEPSQRYIPLSFFIKEKDAFFWQTQIEGAYKQKIGEDQLAAAIAKFDEETEGETSKVGPAKKRLTAWLDRWTEKMNEPKPRRGGLNNGHSKQPTQFETAKYYTNFIHDDKDGEDEPHEANTESFRTPFGHRIIIDIPDNPFKNMAAMIGWDPKIKAFYVFAIHAGHDLSDEPYLDCYFEGYNSEIEQQAKERKAKQKAKTELKEIVANDPDGFDITYHEAQKHIDALSKILGEDNEAVMAVMHENHITADYRKMQEEELV